MKPALFEYHAPTSVEEAIALLARYEGEARPLAGGQSLVPAMNFRLAQPAVLVDLNRIDALSGIRELADGGLRIGAMTRQRAVERSGAVAARAPLLAETMPHVAHPQIRNRGTFGGSLAHADPAAELPAVALALDARFHLRGPRGMREVAAADFYLGLFETALDPDELLVQVELPPMAPRTGWAFEEVARRHGDYAMAGAAALVTLDEAGRVARARLLYFSLSDVPVEAAAAGMLVGSAADEAAIGAVAAGAADALDPGGDIHATADYRRHLAAVLARRTLTRAAVRARGEGEG